MDRPRARPGPPRARGDRPGHGRLHPPEASHLLLLEAVAGTQLVGAAHEAAVAGGYLWHEFGDSMLLIP